jgi:hypothetical protein
VDVSRGTLYPSKKTSGVRQAARAKGARGRASQVGFCEKGMVL